MPIDRRIGSKVPDRFKTESAPQARLDPGPFIGEVMNNYDPTHSGRLQVYIKDIGGSNREDPNTWKTVSLCTPYYGLTQQGDFKIGRDLDNKDPGSFKDTKQSYGMWFTPPDMGVKVLCTMVQGRASDGFWFGSIIEDFNLGMIPGGASSEDYVKDATTKDYENYTTLPVGEFLHNNANLGNQNWSKNKKPINKDLADKLIKQGLLEDPLRGTTTSSAQRESPSAVFGINTPGRMSPDTKDLDAEFKSKLIAGTVTEEEIQAKIKNEYRKPGASFVMDDGDFDGKNNLTRIRTSTGHQIVFHDTENFIYIANGSGTAWIELTDNGKMDVFTTDSVSIRSKNDINLHADKNINMFAGGNISMVSEGLLRAEAVKGMELFSDSYGRLHTKGAMNIRAENDIRIDAEGSNNFKSCGVTLVTGSCIDLNGEPAAPAETLTRTTRNNIPDVDWNGKKFDEIKCTKTIVPRLPAHEPWKYHENTGLEPNGCGIPVSGATGTSEDPGCSIEDMGDVSGKFDKGAPGDIIYDSVRGWSYGTYKFGTVPPALSGSLGVAGPSSSPSDAKNALKIAMDKANLTDNDRRASLAAMVQGECGFRPRSEGSYAGSSAERIKKLFSATRSLSDSQVDQVKQDKTAFFNLVYGPTGKGRDLGNTQDGDGAKYIGRGMIQITGRSNYTKYGAKINQPIVENPDLANDVQVSADIAVAFHMATFGTRGGTNTFEKTAFPVNKYVSPEKRTAYAEYTRTGEFNYGGATAAPADANSTDLGNYITYCQTLHKPIYDSLSGAGGTQSAKVGADNFKTAWKSNDLGKESEFAKSQFDFAKTYLYNPLAQKLKDAGLDLCNKSIAFREVIWSTAVQHGPDVGFTIITTALGSEITTIAEKDAIPKIYDERGAQNGAKYFPKNTPEEQAANVSRYGEEKAAALALLGS